VIHGSIARHLDERLAPAGGETRCDKSEDVQTIAILREDRDALQRRVEELEAEIKRLCSK
jgi:hypothetical protein